MSALLIKVATADGKYAFESSREKILIGSDFHADWVCLDPGISRHHAFIVKTIDGWTILDLFSTNGVYVNGERVKEAALKNGEQFTLGVVTFTVYEQEAALAMSVVAQAEVQELTESEIFAGSHVLASEVSLNKILTSKESLEEISYYEQPMDIFSREDKSKIEVLVYSSGTLVGVDYLNWPLTEIKLSSSPGRKKSVFFPGLNDDIILQIKENTIICPDHFSSSTSKNLPLSSEAQFFYMGTQQISFRLVTSSFKPLPIPAWVRDKEYFQHLIKVVAGLFLPFLLLLFVTWPIQEEDKEVTIVYQEIVPPVEEKLANTEVLTDVKPREQEQAPEVKKDPQKIVKARAKSDNPKPELPPAPTPEPAPVPKKTFSFKSSTSIAPSVVDGTVALNNPSSNSKSVAAPGVSGVVADTASLNHKAGGGSKDGSAAGFDVDGRGAASLGARGLVKKKGFDHSYIEPRTVVLGSMDPELLRKILQEYLPQFRHCYQQELSRNSGVKGVIDLNFAITPEGRVGKTNIRAKDARFSGKGIGCMDSVLKMIVFPKPKGGGVVDVKQPLNFLSETEKI